MSMIDPATTVKMTVQFNLFGGTVFRLGTERHHHLLDGIDSLADIGCFGLTELGFGNNAIEMETTATYNKARVETVSQVKKVKIFLFVDHAENLHS